ncbi:MAG: UDP-N-acetylmuramoyl-tripeptide--D-alanyl-D-alanine ligase [Firmicutes bacterium]|nr:UDP-N-acetylmuramoyl-tripeptide--D-alanyl-D-alanine ligase [Bacillota bacterium]
MSFTGIRVEDVIRVCGGEAAGGAPPGWLGRALAGVATDTREDVNGKLFVPLKGEKFDGHDFIGAAFAGGALACLFGNAPGTYTGENKNRIIYANPTLKALLELAAYYKSLFSVKTIAITGSSGKTTTKELAAGVLSQKYNTLKTEANLNNQIGVPKTIFRLEERHEALVLEMGMNHFGEIRSLSVTARPDLAVITNIGFAHLENLGSREGILWAKSEIFDGMAPDAAAVLNGNDEYLRTLAGKRENIVWFGFGKANDFFAEEMERDGFGVSCRLRSPRYGLDIRVRIPAPGNHMVLNALAAAAAGSLLGVAPDGVRRGIEAFENCENRMDIYKAGGFTVLDDAYNANPASVKAALDVLAEQSGFKTAILGDMLELGAMGARLHVEIGEYAARKGVDRLIAVGPESARTRDGFERRKGPGQTAAYYPDAKEFAGIFKDEVMPGLDEGAVLIKASHGMALSGVAKILRGIYTGVRKH